MSILNYYYYTSDGKQTLSSICSQNSCDKSLLLILNQNVEYTKKITNYYGEEEEITVPLSGELRAWDLSGSKIPANISIRIPESNSGGLETKSSKYNTEEVTRRSYSYNSFGNQHDSHRKGNYSYNSFGSIHDNYKRGALSSAGRDFNCYMYVLLNGSEHSVWNLPVYPQEFSDTNSAKFSSVSLLGRSVDYQIYQGSSRDVSFTLNLHEELCDDYNYIHDLVAQIQSACYPGYGEGRVQVPEIFFSIGDQFKIRGILESCNAVWKTPIIDGRLINCDLSLGVKETTGPYSQSEISSFGGRRG